MLITQASTFERVRDLERSYEAELSNYLQCSGEEPGYFLPFGYGIPGSRISGGAGLYRGWIQWGPTPTDPIAEPRQDAMPPICGVKESLIAFAHGRHGLAHHISTVCLEWGLNERS